MICANCHKRIYKQRDGTWYHDRNGSVSCRPGEGSSQRARPVAGDPFLTPGDEEAEDTP